MASGGLLRFQIDSPSPGGGRDVITAASVLRDRDCDRPASTRPWVVTLGLLWAAVLTLWMLLSPSIADSNQTEVLILATSLTSLGLLGAKMMAGDRRLLVALADLKMGPWVGVGFAVGFGVATLVWLGDVPYYSDLVQPSSLAAGGVVAGIGFVVFVVGYRFTPKILEAGMNRVDGTLRGGGRVAVGPGSVWTLWLIAAAAFALSFKLGSLGYLSDPAAAMSTTSSAGEILAAMAQTGVLATLVAARRVADQRSAGSVILLVFVIGTQFIGGLFQGSKEVAILQLVAFVVGYSARRKLKIRTVVVSAGIAFVVIAPFVTAYRTHLNGSNGRLTPVEALTSINFTQLTGSALNQHDAGGSQDQFLMRWSRIGDVSIIVTQSPSPIPFVSPVELLAGPFLGFIPRSIWPGKPILNAGYEINQIYYGAAPTTYSSAATTVYADLYRHGGLIVVILGMLLLGFFVRMVDSRTSTAGEFDLRLMFLPMLLFTSLVKQETDYLALSASLVSIILTAAISVRLVSRRTDGGLKRVSA